MNKKWLIILLVTVCLLALMAVIGIGMMKFPIVLMLVVIGGAAFMAYALVNSF